VTTGTTAKKTTHGRADAFPRLTGSWTRKLASTERRQRREESSYGASWRQTTGWYLGVFKTVKGNSTGGTWEGEALTSAGKQKGGKGGDAKRRKRRKTWRLTSRIQIYARQNARPGRCGVAFGNVGPRRASTGGVTRVSRVETAKRRVGGERRTVRAGKNAA